MENSNVCNYCSCFKDVEEFYKDNYCNDCEIIHYLDKSISLALTAKKFNLSIHRIKNVINEKEILTPLYNKIKTYYYTNDELDNCVFNHIEKILKN